MPTLRTPAVFAASAASLMAGSSSSVCLLHLQRLAHFVQKLTCSPAEIMWIRSNLLRLGEQERCSLLWPGGEPECQRVANSTRKSVRYLILTAKSWCLERFLAKYYHHSCVSGHSSTTFVASRLAAYPFRGPVPLRGPVPSRALRRDIITRTDAKAFGVSISLKHTHPHAPHAHLTYVCLRGGRKGGVQPSCTNSMYCRRVLQGAEGCARNKPQNLRARILTALYGACETLLSNTLCHTLVIFYNMLNSPCLLNRRLYRQTSNVTMSTYSGCASSHGRNNVEITWLRFSCWREQR
eukprot:GFKZ01008091.1.p1 GENE.GFKZ01008091.1~~GFKZ01008091.1.p1  ORF type:complete len:295 (+),score=-5.36 GFKZ01008091.1:264-1148(+)